MTQQEIQERNKQIALMLGWIDGDGDLIVPNKLSNGTNYSEWADTKNVKRDDLFAGCVMTHYINTTQEGFSSDWNWLMEAVEFIESKSYQVWIGKYASSITKDKDLGFQINSRTGLNKKEAVFIVVSDFAKLYNNKEL